MSANAVNLSNIRDLFSLQIVPLLLTVLLGRFLTYTSIGVILLTLLAFSFSVYFLIKFLKKQNSIGIYEMSYYWLTTGAGIVYLLNPTWMESFKEILAAVSLILLLTKFLFQAKYFQSVPVLQSFANESAYKEFSWFYIGFLILFM
ncbi:MAG: hypothetical protein ACK4WD_06850 [Flavobacteriales bacterium]|jgi:hypothetical protein